MVEPQESSILSKMLKLKQNQDRQFLEEGSGLPKEIIQKSERRIIAF